MNLTEKKSQVFEALLGHKGVQHVLDVGAAALDNPVFVLDMSWGVVARSQTDEFGEEFWEGFFASGTSADAIGELDRAGVYAELLASDQPVYGSIASYPGRFLGTRIRDRADVVGMICLCEENAIAEGDADLLVDLARAIALEMVYQGQVATRKLPVTALVGDLLAGRVNNNSLTSRLAMLGIAPSENMRLVCVSFPASATGVPLYLTQSQVEHNVSCVLSCIVENNVLVVVDAGTASLSTIQRCCSGEGWRMGVSSAFDDLSKLKRAYDQAFAAIDLCDRLGRNESVCHYDSVYLYHFLQTAARSQDLSSFYDPAALQMLAYDRENGTDYAGTVEAYVESGRSVSTCAERLFIARSTLYYRFRKVSELFGVDLADEDRCFSLELTFRLLKVIG